MIPRDAIELAREALEIEAGERCGSCGLRVATTDDWDRCDANGATSDERGEGLCWDEGSGACADRPLPHVVAIARALLTAEQEQDARRDSLAQEIREGLRVRGLYAPQHASDLIGAVFVAIDNTKETK